MIIVCDFISKGGEELIKVNGKEMEFTENMTIYDLINSLSYDKDKIAVERMGEIVLKKDYRETHVVDGDRIEIVCFMGGG